MTPATAAAAGLLGCGGAALIALGATALRRSTRRSRTGRRSARQFAELADQIASGDAEPGEHRWCTEEMRTTYHAIHRDGSRTCWTCHTTTSEEQ